MRLFFALWPPELVANSLETIAGGLAGRLGGRATRPETIHLTLAFLGEQPAERLPTILAAANAVRMTSFDLSVDRLDGWRHNRLLWAGCQSVPGALLALVDGVRGALRQASIPFDDAPRRFVPHLTLVRKLPDAAFPFASSAMTPLSWRCDRFVLVESRLSSNGPNYRVLAEFAAGE